MNEELPPELKGFQKRNVLHVGLVALFTFAVACIGNYRQERIASSDGVQVALMVMFVLGVLTFMGMILFKANMALPRCPKCGRKMRQTGAITMNRLKSNWRIVECRDCGETYRIRGMSFGG